MTIAEQVEAISKDPAGPYYLALGSFITQYAQLESITHLLLINVSCVSQDVGRAIYSGNRIKDNIDNINKVLICTNRNTELESYKPYFDHIGIVTAIRNIILHYGGNYDSEIKASVLSTERIAYIPTKNKRYVVSETDLYALRSDVLRCVVGIISVWIPAQITPELRSSFQQTLDQPWQYKQIQPEVLET